MRNQAVMAKLPSVATIIMRKHSVKMVLIFIQFLYINDTDLSIFSKFFPERVFGIFSGGFGYPKILSLVSLIMAFGVCHF